MFFYKSSHGNIADAAFIVSFTDKSRHREDACNEVIKLAHGSWKCNEAFDSLISRYLVIYLGKKMLSIFFKWYKIELFLRRQRFMLPGFARVKRGRIA